MNIPYQGVNVVMNRRLVLALAGALVTTASVVPASAQRYMMRQPIKQLKSTASTTSAPTPVVPKTLVCSNLQMGKTAYPEQDVQGPLKTSPTQDEAFAACNEVGAQYGEVFKTYNNCRVYKAGTNTWYTYLVRATGIYDYGNDAYAKSIVGNATCTYNP